MSDINVKKKYKLHITNKKRIWTITGNKCPLKKKSWSEFSWLSDSRGKVLHLALPHIHRVSQSDNCVYHSCLMTFSPSHPHYFSVPCQFLWSLIERNCHSHSFWLSFTLSVEVIHFKLTLAPNFLPNSPHTERHKTLQ